MKISAQNFKRNRLRAYKSNVLVSTDYYSDISKQYYCELVLKVRMWDLPQFKK
ncbi:hypothetical protein LEP1GSC172_2588 [Leptospira noguchii]|uniref:Uncharacterized protein n=1 Tax=Leptospira noguchii TaxID=28182 RepID=M6VF87_9LEPT|nr:hypothetical protein LEP1GSC172_2588 [Leptospira noguchii]